MFTAKIRHGQTTVFPGQVGMIIHIPAKRCPQPTDNIKLPFLRYDQLLLIRDALSKQISSATDVLKVIDVMIEGRHEQTEIDLEHRFPVSLPDDWNPEDGSPIRYNPGQCEQVAHD